MRCKICLTVASKPANLASLFYGGALRIPRAIFFFFEHTIVSVCTFACSLVHSINAHMHIYIVFVFFYCALKLSENNDHFCRNLQLGLTKQNAS